MSVLPQAIAPNPDTNLLNVYIQIANKMGVSNKKTDYAHSITERISSSTYLKGCGNLKANHHSSFTKFVALLRLIYSSVQVSDAHSYYSLQAH
jgi:hypothetical protein